MVLSFEKICRSCMTESAELIPIWNVSEENAYTVSTHSDSVPFGVTSPREMMLNEFTKFGVSRNDKLPKNICMDCLVDMKHAFVFKQKCQRSETKLRTYLMSNQSVHNETRCNPVVLDVRSLQMNCQQEFRNESPQNEILTEQEIVQEKQISVVYQCIKCLAELSSSDEIEQHMMNEHSEPPSSGETESLEIVSPLFDCSLCPAKSDQQKTLEQHYQSHRNAMSERVKMEHYPPRMVRNSAEDQYEEVQSETYENDYGFDENVMYQQYIELPMNEVGTDLNQYQAHRAPLTGHLNQMDATLSVVKCGLCTAEFTQMDLLDQHRQSHPTLKVVLMDCADRVNEATTMNIACNYCSATFSRQGTLNIHLREVHKMVNLIGEQQTKDDIMRHTKIKPFKCDKCLFTFSFKSSLNRHKLIHIGDRPFKCNDCLASFSTNHALNVHTRQHIRVQSFVPQTNLNENDAHQTVIKPYKCDECSLAFLRKLTLKRHMLTHTGPYKCSICPKSFITSPTLDIHMRRTHTASLPFVCKVCGKNFTNRTGLNIHAKRHSGNKPYKCDKCSWKFYHKCDLTRHIAVHSDARPFCCKICEKTFRQAIHLRRHLIRIHSKNLPFKCNGCSKLFTTNLELNDHIKTHTSEQPIDSESINLNEPVIVQANIKPFKCSKCSSSFDFESNLNRHMLKHTDTKNLICKTCGKGLTGSNSFKRHMIRHSGYKPYKCNECSWAFCMKSDLNRHYLKHTRARR